MRKGLIGLMAVAGVTIAGPASSQGVYFGAPGVEVEVGRPHYRDYDGPRHRSYEYDRPRYRAYGYGRDCRTITIQRDDGSVRRIRRCD